MKIRAIRTQIRTYEVNKEYYPEGLTDEQILATDTACAKDDPDLFFDDCDSDSIEVETITKSK